MQTTPQTRTICVHPTRRTYRRPLGAVGEVAELGLPHRQRIGPQRIAVLEAKHRLLRREPVEGLGMALIGAPVIERGDAPAPDRSGRVPSRESAALAVPARQAHPIALLQQGGEGQMLGGRLIDAGTVVDRIGDGRALASLCDGPRSGRACGELAADIPKHRDVDPVTPRRGSSSWSADPNPPICRRASPPCWAVAGPASSSESSCARQSALAF